MAYGDADCACTAHHHCGCYDNPYQAADAANWGSEYAYQQAQQQVSQKQKDASAAIFEPAKPLSEKLEQIPRIDRYLPAAGIGFMLFCNPADYLPIGQAGSYCILLALSVLATLFIRPWRYLPEPHIEAGSDAYQNKVSRAGAVTRQSSRAPAAGQMPTWRDRAPVIAFPGRPLRPQTQPQRTGQPQTGQPQSGQPVREVA